MMIWTQIIAALRECSPNWQVVTCCMWARTVKWGHLQQPNTDLPIALVIVNVRQSQNYSPESLWKDYQQHFTDKQTCLLFQFPWRWGHTESDFGTQTHAESSFSPKSTMKSCSFVPFCTLVRIYISSPWERESILKWKIDMSAEIQSLTPRVKSEHPIGKQQNVFDSLFQLHF